MRAVILTLLALVVAVPAVAQIPAGVKQKRGDFAFLYRNPYTPQELEWLGRFDVVVTGSFVPEEQVRALHQAGSKVIYYEWMVAFYGTQTRADNPTERFQADVLANHPDWLLNPETGLFGGAGSDSIPAYYYDVASHGLREARVKWLIDLAHETNYDGIFFDTTTIQSVQPEARATFAERYPGDSYDAYVARMLAMLRGTRPTCSSSPTRATAPTPTTCPSPSAT